MKRALLIVLIAAAAAPGQTLSTAIRTNAGFNSKSIPRNDDGSAPVEDLGFTINFFGKQRSQAYVNNNGNVTFDSALATFTPFGLANTAREIIAPFFADVDTRPAGSALVTYGRDTVNGHPAFGVNYLNVGYYNIHAEKLNSFQLVIIDRSDVGQGNFDIEFNYSRVQWETGDASNGIGGLGGTSAAVGWSNGTGGGSSFELEGSRIPGSFIDGGPFALVRQKLNSTVPGRLLFRARNGQLIPPLSILTGCPLPGASLNTPYSQRMFGTGGGTNYRWSLLADPGSSFVPGLNLSPDGLLTGTPAALGTTSFTLHLTAATEDGDQTVARRCSLTVNPPVLNISSSCPLPAATVGQPYLKTLSVNGGNQPYTWSLADGSSISAPGLSLASDGSIRGVPTAGGTYFFTLQVASAGSDGAAPATKNCGITVNPAVLNLTSSCSLPPATSGVPYQQTLMVNGGTAPYTWTYSGGLPTGLSLSSSGQISGTPNGPASSAFTAIVTDSRGRSISQNCALTVSAPQINITTSCPLPRATTGRAYLQRLSASGGSAPYSWSVVGALPAGLTITGDGLVSGTPMNTGPHSFRLLASDSSGNNVAAACSLQVLPADFFSPSCPLPNGTVGVPYQQLLRSVGGVDPVIFTTAGTLPPGLTLNTFGYVLGTPAKPGTYPLSIRIQDSQGQIATQSCSLLIQPSPVQIESSCPLPQGRVGVPYSASFGANGGTPPYKFFLEGTLPPGLSLDSSGNISGSPAAQADRAFYVRVADSQGVTNVIDCAVSVALPDVPPMTFTRIQDTYPSASAGPVITLQLGANYILPIQGTINLKATADTGEAGAANQADPRVRFANGQTSFNFTLQPGKTSVSMAIPSTGTVAGTVVVTADNLRAGGNPVTLGATPVSFRIPRQAPVITDACFTTKPTGAEATVTGYSTTRSLRTAAFTFTTGTSSAQQTANIDVSGSAADFFLSDDSIRNGGAFTVTFPFTDAGVTPGSVNMTVSNSAGTSPSKQLTPCR